MSITRKWTITVQISPYVGGLAPETYDFIRQLNDEAKRLRTGVSFIALANRILAHGYLERAVKFAKTLGAWQLHRAFADGYLAHQPKPRWETPAIGGEEIVLRRGNSQYRKKLRRLEKNHFRAKEYEYPRRNKLRRPSDNIDLKTLVKIAAGTLYQLIESIPSAERARLERLAIPADFHRALIPLPQQCNWNWRKLERWKREGVVLCGISSRASLGRLAWPS